MQKLGLDAEYVLPAFEDPAHWLQKEVALPANVDPSDSRLSDPEERSRMARVFDQGLNKPKGFVLPIQRWNAAAKPHPGRWRSEHWKVRRGNLFLTPGDSPLGLRLPIASLEHVPPEEFPYIVEQDPMEPRGELPSFDKDAAAKDAKTKEKAKLEPVRTAMSIELRDGVLCAFMPPVEKLEDYLELITAVEATAEEMQLQVHVEGYSPPYDPRVEVIKVTPDPGVIEINVQPAQSWREAVDITFGLYEDATKTRLGANRFLVDGRHTGTGGGNHIVVAAARRRIRRSCAVRFAEEPVLYWQRHPSLSYLFSGMFIGPTSQAPRIDEARHDGLYELEIALAHVPPPGIEAPLWLVDRLFRHILVDLTGNTHRAEICIDKLYSPDGPTGRLGLVEFRALEMPPDPRMSLAQQLLIRALIAKLWREPQQGKFVRWGTTLHDRFMLPHFLWEDFWACSKSSCNPATNSRWNGIRHSLSSFPGVRPRPSWWGGAGAASGAGALACARRRGLGRRHRALCRFCPWRGCRSRRRASSKAATSSPATAGDAMTATGRSGESVAGVRFKAWQPASGLHPTIPVHAPLTFDLIDTWNGRSLGGCVYHVATRRPQL